MIIRVSEIPDEGYVYNICDRRKFVEVFNIKMELLSPIEGYLKVVRREHGKVDIEGLVSCKIMLSCSRCLEIFDYYIEQSFKDELFPANYFSDSETRLSKEDLDTGFYVGDEIDLMAIYMEKIYLNIPMKPLCSKNCKGLCPVCGTNLNLSSCSCDREIIDPRWDKLKSIKEKLFKG